MNNFFELKHGPERKKYVSRMFNSIAHRYDFLNHLLSAGTDIWWRKKAVAKLNLTPASHVLDLACGTGDLGFEINRRFQCRVTGVDIAGQMLQIGKHKIDNENIKFSFLNGDGEQLPFRDGVFDAAGIAFGIRNMGNIPQAIAEMARVLCRQGEIVILEFSLPSNRLIRNMYGFYFNQILPLVGRIISRDPEAYTYLPASVNDFPSVGSFVDLMQSSGFVSVTATRLFNGIAVIYYGRKA